jgi:hypothetical protein
MHTFNIRPDATRANGERHPTPPPGKGPGLITALHHHLLLCNEQHRGSAELLPELQEAAKIAWRCPQIYYILNKKYSNNQAEAKSQLPM